MCFLCNMKKCTLFDYSAYKTIRLFFYFYERTAVVMILLEDLELAKNSVHAASVFDNKVMVGIEAKIRPNSTTVQLETSITSIVYLDIK